MRQHFHRWWDAETSHIISFLHTSVFRRRVEVPDSHWGLGLILWSIWFNQKGKSGLVKHSAQCCRPKSSRNAPDSRQFYSSVTLLAYFEFLLIYTGIKEWNPTPQFLGAYPNPSSGPQSLSHYYPCMHPHNTGMKAQHSQTAVEIQNSCSASWFAIGMTCFSFLHTVWGGQVRFFFIQMYSQVNKSIFAANQSMHLFSVCKV